MSRIVIVLLMYRRHKPIDVHVPIDSSSLVITTELKIKYTFFCCSFMFYP
jgi:hypothetical protein